MPLCPTDPHPVSLVFSSSSLHATTALLSRSLKKQLWLCYPFHDAVFFGRFPILYLHPALGVGMGLLVTRPQIKPSPGPSWGQSPREVERDQSWNQAINDGWVGRDGLGFVSYFYWETGSKGRAWVTASVVSGSSAARIPIRKAGPLLFALFGLRWRQWGALSTAGHSPSLWLPRWPELRPAGLKL